MAGFLRLASSSATSASTGLTPRNSGCQWSEAGWPWKAPLVALIVRDEDLALRADADAVGLAETAGEDVDGAGARVDLQRAAAVGHRRVVAELVDLALDGILDRARLSDELHAGGRARLGAAGGEAERDVEVPVFVADRAGDELVVVAREAPAVGDGLEGVGLAVAVGVGDAGELGDLCDVEGAGLLGGPDAHGGLQAVGETLPALGLGVERVDVAAAESGVEFLIRTEGDGGDFRLDAFGAGDGLDAVGGGGDLCPSRTD